MCSALRKITRPASACAGLACVDARSESNETRSPSCVVGLENRLSLILLVGRESLGNDGREDAVVALHREQALLALLAWIGDRIPLLAWIGDRIRAHHLDHLVDGQSGGRLVGKLERVARRRLEQASPRAKGEVGERKLGVDVGVADGGQLVDRDRAVALDHAHAGVEQSVALVESVALRGAK